MLKRGDKPPHSNLGEKSRRLNETSPPILVCESRRRQLLTGIAQIGKISPWCTRKCSHAPHRAGGQAGCGHSNSGNGAVFPSEKSQFFKYFPLVRSLDEASLGQVTKLAPDAKWQVFQGHGSGEVAFQAEELIDVVVGPAIFGDREE
ncbi:hypothetical protein TNCV_2802661 [Trichonephila clavipes]|nr:hypothetical protein TNCV_2802661 [Trichonephila clavipes]